MKTTTLCALVHSTIFSLAAASMLLVPHAVRAEIIDLANAPLANATTTSVRPNHVYP